MPTPQLSWGHVNLNVRDLEGSIGFYEALGFKVFLPGIPYLGIRREGSSAEIPAACAEALGLDPGTHAKGCIVGLPGGFPMLDLTQFDGTESSNPSASAADGWSRICLASRDLVGDCEALRNRGIAFVSEPRSDPGGLAKIATCLDPDGNRIELIEIAPENWPRPETSPSSDSSETSTAE